MKSVCVMAVYTICVIKIVVSQQDGRIILRWFLERLRWSRGSVLAFGTQVRGFEPGRSRRIF